MITFVALSTLLSVGVVRLWMRARTYCDCINYYPSAPPTDFFLINYNPKSFSISTGPDVIDIAYGAKSMGWGTAFNKVEKGLSYRCEKRGDYLGVPDSWSYGMVMQVPNPFDSGTFRYGHDQFVDASCDWRPATHGFAGFRWETPRDRPIRSTFPIYLAACRLSLPMWLLILMFAVPAVAAVSNRIKWRRPVEPGFCGACGYDLRATPDRCPECGKVVERLSNFKPH